jgi:hypothetical protein
MNGFGNLGKLLCSVIYLALALSMAACVTMDEKKEAINAVNQAFRAEYEKILNEKGKRTFSIPRVEAFNDMRVAMAGLGMVTETQDQSLGYLVVSAPAPRPLTAEEWQRSADADLPLLKRVILPFVGGLAASFIQFEPQGVDIVISATFTETTAGTEILLTARLRETGPPKSGWPRREYLPPTATRAGLDRIWDSFQHELRAAPAAPRR